MPQISPISWIFITLMVICILMAISTSFFPLSNLDTYKKYQVSKKPQIKW